MRPTLLGNIEPGAADGCVHGPESLPRILRLRQEGMTAQPAANGYRSARAAVPLLHCHRGAQDSRDLHREGLRLVVSRESGVPSVGNEGQFGPLVGGLPPPPASGLLRRILQGPPGPH